ncbi:PD-(D/E)XK nuclease family protein [Rufibacter ruber]|uniref:PD-(D/E)XK nuclease family protein n=1 Tax=Rufibacter ruber TaxID=1783499 RepID=UPI000834B1FC|nr:PD-(D/E)XK nuclease family protein [Rufibacter ruber]
MHSLDIIPVEAILERDIDLLLLVELSCNSDFLHWFLSTTELPALQKLEGVWRSVSAFGLGETDILVSYLSENEKIYLLIENKIDAGFQEEQPQRYQQRGIKYVEEGCCHNYYPLLIAPEKYLNTQLDFGKALSYEQIRNWFNGREEPRFMFKATLLEIAIEKLRRGYKAVNHVAVQKFMVSYWERALQQLPALLMNKPEVVPAGSDWIQLSSKLLKRLNIILYHKLARGHIDARLGNFQESQVNALRAILPPMLVLEQTGKSWSIRKETVTLDRMQDFAAQYEKAQQAFDDINLVNQWLEANSNYLAP